MKFNLLRFLALFFALTLQALAQDAAQPAVDLQSKANELPAPAISPSSTPALPELSALDEAFKQTTLGKDADEMRMRLEMRKLQNDVVNDPDIVSAKAAAGAAPTDLEKRDRLRDYYDLYYGRMSSKTSSPGLKAAIEKEKREHVALLSQPRVRPGSGEPPPKRKKKERRRHKGGP
jgi:hypothetical protein